jgi:uncharacterized membrane protein YoaK (UPF0700 family)
VGSGGDPGKRSSPDHPGPEALSREWDALVLLLTWAAGSVDAISYLGLGHVFTANMTGNTVLLGLALGQRQGLAALRSMIALAGFAGGAAMGALIVERGPKQAGWPPGVTRALLLEGVILVIFTITWRIPAAAQSARLVYALIALSALAMGIQSAAIRHLNVPGVATTYITGTLTSMVVGLVGWVGSADLLVAAAASEGGTVAPVPASSRKKQMIRLQAAVFLVYGLAAVASGIVETRGSSLASLSPLAAVAFVVMFASLRHRHR